MTYWQTVGAVLTAIGIAIMFWSLPYVLAYWWDNRPRIRRSGAGPTAKQAERAWRQAMEDERSS